MTKRPFDLIVRSRDGEIISSCFDLTKYLYSGWFKYDNRKVSRLIAQGRFGAPDLARLPVVSLFKDFLDDYIVAGKSVHSCKSMIRDFSLYLRFIEDQSLSFNRELLVQNYLDFAEHIYFKVHVEKKIKQSTGYNNLSRLGYVLGGMLDIPRQGNLIKRVRLKKPPSSRKAVAKEADKQNLEEAFTFGRFLTELTKGLTPEAILGQLPLFIESRTASPEDGRLDLGYCFDPAPPPESAPSNVIGRYENAIARRRAAAQPIESISDDLGRIAWVNLRVQAEMMLFFAMTGMNAAQAHSLPLETSIKYESLGQKWRVRLYKNRKGGEVCFDFYKEYRPHFKAYLAFLKRFFLDTKYLFPRMCADGSEYKRNPDSKISVASLRNFTIAQSVPWVSPSTIRNTRINYFLRRSGDEELASEIAQNTVSVLKQNYEKPSQQRAMTEITRFWSANDPLKKDVLVTSIEGGLCNGNPELEDIAPPEIPVPNCVTPSGCLWCVNHRDIDEFEYVWELVTFKFLKSVELILNMQVTDAPADLVVERLAAKIDFFRQSGGERTEWVLEAEARIEEGDYHPNFAKNIKLLESLT